MIVMSLVAAMLSAGAEAMPVKAVMESDTGARASRELYVCTRDDASRRAFKREHGQVIFVSAKEAASSRGWDAPRCITAAEYKRLTALVGDVRWVKD